MFNDAQIYNGWIQRMSVDMKSNKGGAYVGEHSMRVIDPETRVNGTKEKERDERMDAHVASRRVHPNRTFLHTLYETIHAPRRILE